MLIIQKSEHPVVVFECRIFVPPREAAPVFRIGSSGKACLISVIHTRHSRYRILERREQHYLLYRGSTVLISCHHRKDTLTVMASDQVESTIEVLLRIVFRKAHQPLACFICRNSIVYVVEQDRSQRIVHRTIEFIPREVLSSLSIADLVARVLPHLTYEQVVTVRKLNASTHGFDE